MDELMETPQSTPQDQGNPRYFQNQHYHFQTLRVAGVAPADGADLSEIAETIRHIVAGDDQGWHRAWSATAARIEHLAGAYADPVSKGLALFRAHNYYRTAEFMLPPSDPKRSDTFDKSQDTFNRGLDALGVPHERIAVPFDGIALNAVFFPGPAPKSGKPLIVVVGGFDSTLEELYFQLGRSANERGYSVLAYEGPGQGAVLRKQGAPFVAEWERPNSAILNAFLANHDKPAHIVILGVSMGGYFAPRAASFDERIDGVITYDVFFDPYAISTAMLPPDAVALKAKGEDAAADALIAEKMRLQAGFRWAMNNAMWTIGKPDPFTAVMSTKDWVLEGVARRIKGDVLILAGEHDHYLPVTQVDDFKRELTGARSVEAVIYDKQSGGSEHCQRGALTLWHATLFDWLARKFPADGDPV